MKRPAATLCGMIALMCMACSKHEIVAGSQGFGPNPTLPPPHSNLIPTVNIAPAKGWRVGEKPLAASGLAVNAFATGLNHPRWLYVLPNGDVLVSEANAPKVHDSGSGLKGWIMRLVQKKAGAGVPSANRITLLRDADDDGTAETRNVFLSNLNSPFGMALVEGNLYVANTDELVRFPYQSGANAITAAGTKVMDLPAGPINHHWTKNIIASPDQKRLYIAIGSNSNVGERGLEVEKGRAAIYELELATSLSKIFASGLRNPVGMSFNPVSKKLWVSVNERDEIGSDLVPDYMTEVKQDGFYGWPYSYYGAHPDVRVKPQRPDMASKAITPDYALGAHTASLGLTFYSGDLLPTRYKNGVFIGQHGSWNRQTPSGYKVVFIPFVNGKPSGKPEDVLTGFLDAKGNAQGRPVGVMSDNKGALLVADDVGNTIWRVVSQKPFKSMDKQLKI